MARGDRIFTIKRRAAAPCLFVSVLINGRTCNYDAHFSIESIFEGVMPDTQPESRVALRGSLSIGACEAQHLEIANAIRSGRAIVIETDSDCEVDLTFVQLLIAAKRSADRSGKLVALAQPPSAALAGALRSCGFNPAPGTTALKDILQFPDRRAS